MPEIFEKNSVGRACSIEREWEYSFDVCVLFLRMINKWTDKNNNKIVALFCHHRLRFRRETDNERGRDIRAHQSLIELKMQCEKKEKIRRATVQLFTFYSQQVSKKKLNEGNIDMQRTTLVYSIHTIIYKYTYKNIHAHTHL